METRMGWEWLDDVGHWFKEAAEDVGDWFSNRIDDIGDVLSSIRDRVPGLNAVIDVATSAIDKTEDALTSLRDYAGEVPGIGGLLHGVASVLAEPFSISHEIIHGQRIDRVVMHSFDRDIQTIKEVGPWVQAVISLIPGIGPLVSGAISGGVALASGMPIDDVMVAAAAGAIPGAGAFVSGSIRAGYHTIRTAVATGNVDVSELAGTLSQQIPGLPPVAAHGIAAGVSLTQNLAQGRPVSQSALSFASSVLPSIMDTDAAKKLLDDAQSRIPEVSSNAIQTIGNALSSLKNTAPNLTPAQQSALSGMLKIATTIGVAQALQAKKTRALSNTDIAQIAESGQKIAAAVPTVAAAREMVPRPTAFDVGLALSSFKNANIYIYRTLRDSMKGDDLTSFYAGIAVRNGLSKLTRPLVVRTESEAHETAGYYTALGLYGAPPPVQSRVLSLMQKNPSAVKGIARAETRIRARSGFFHRVLKTFGFFSA